jgi:AsmA-like C-terminal region
MAAWPIPRPDISEVPAREQQGRRWRKSAVLLILLAVICIAFSAVLCGVFWPFTQAKVVKMLEDESDSKVQVQTFRRVYFPRPGCVMEGVTFVRGDAAHPVITVQKLAIKTTYLGILVSHVSRIVADGVRVSIPAIGNGQGFQTKRSNVTVGEIVAKDAVLEFARQGQSEPLRFDVHEITLRDVGWSRPLHYQVKLHNPTPPGEITANGEFGVWNLSDPGETPVSGEYKFDRADLGVFGGIAGTLASSGKFTGKLKHIDVQGKTDVPDFEVRSSSHKVDLKTEFNAYVDGTNGDTFLKRVDAYFRRTHLMAEGTVAKRKGDQGKVARINVSSSDGRIEDVLWLFVRGNRPPMSGVLNMNARIELPPGSRPFLQKIKLDGKFGVVQGQFPNTTAQQDVDKLSAGARRGDNNKEDPETVLTGLAGHVALNDGVARFDDLVFGVPGAAARLRGTYSLLNHGIDLRGQMKVDTEVADTTTGVKSLLLKVMNPFFKKRKRGGQILPVKIGGTFEKPTFGLALDDDRAKQVPAPLTRGIRGYERTVPK